jgi:glycosyltransferase involved in cell wall biosynthesis
MIPNRPRFSVVLPTQNRPGWLAAAVDSVVDQTFPDFELWIVDDGSDAEIRSLGRELAEDHRIRVVRNSSPAGAAAARNQGIRAARGEYVAFMDDDCTWHPERLERLDGFLRSHDPEPSYVATQTVLVRSGPPPSYSLDPVLPQGESPWRVGAPMMVVARQALLDVGGFDERLPRSHDWDLAIRLVDRVGGFLLAEPLTWAEDLPGLTADPERLRTASRVLLEKYGRSSPISSQLTVAFHRAVAHKMLILGHGAEGRRHYRRAASLAPSMVVNWATALLAHGGVGLYQLVTGIVARYRVRRQA